jgi:hypothetical protein
MTFLVPSGSAAMVRSEIPFANPMESGEARCVRGERQLLVVRLRYSAFAIAFCAARRIYFVSGLCCLFHFGKTGALTCVAFSF